MKEKKEKSLYEYRLGEIHNVDMMGGMMKKPNKCVAIALTYQSKEGVQMEAKLKHKDFIEDEEEDNN